MSQRKRYKTFNSMKDTTSLLNSRKDLILNDPNLFINHFKRSFRGYEFPKEIATGEEFHVMCAYKIVDVF